MGAGEVEILKFVRRFHVEISLELVVPQMDPDVEEWDTLSTDALGCDFKNHAVSVVVTELQEFVKLFSPVCPDEENVVNVAVPHQRFLLTSFQQVLLDKTHEEICIRWCHFGPHCSATLLEVVSVTEPEYVTIQDQPDEIEYNVDDVDGFPVGGEKVSTTLDTSFRWNIGI